MHPSDEAAVAGTRDDDMVRHAPARRDHDRFRFLADASSRLAASLDLETTLDRVAGLALPALADFGFLDVVEADGQVRRIARAHDDPEMEAALATLRWGPSAHTGLNLSALASGRAGLHPEVDDAFLQRIAEGPDHLAALRRLGIRSLLTVPLEVRGRTVGALTLFHGRSGRRHVREDVELAAELAQRAAVAVENARLYAAARDASRLKDEFLGVVSHELRTPLTAILGWARILESRGHDAATAARAAEVITRNANAQIRIIDDILDVSRIVTGKLKLDLARVDVEPIAVLALEALRPAAEARRVTLSLTRKSPLPPVTGDAARLQQVVWNLLSNAIKFARAGGRVDVRLSAETRAVRVEVADDGVGIPAEFLPHVFDRFAQADSSSTRAHGGLGLGLAIVRHLVELHGGAVIARSDGPGRGATFSVILPSRADGTPERPLSRATAMRLDGLTILFAEDDTDTREAVVTMLEDLGARVVPARSADEALAALDAAAPALLLSDIGMPERDGFALLRLVRARGGHAATIPAVALTAFAGLDDRQRILGAGFAAHVPKPVDPAALSGVIARVVGRR